MSTTQEDYEYIDDLVSFLRRSRDSFEENWHKSDNKPINLKHFSIIRKLGEGSFGRVVLAKKNTSYYAVKIITIKRAKKTKAIQQIHNERRVLQATNFPFIIYLEYFFTDSSRIYIVMPFIAGGDLWDLLRSRRRLTEPDARFYSSQVVLALEYLHYFRIVYRDLKPENILIDISGYLKLADLGFCKKITGRTYTMCGTSEYMAPEVIMNQGYGFGADWWSFGILLFELVHGSTPFFGDGELSTWRNIVSMELGVPIQFSSRLRDLVQKMLQKSPSNRLGNFSNGATDIKDHRWYQELDWIAVLNKKLPPPFFPKKNIVKTSGGKTKVNVVYERNE